DLRRQDRLLFRTRSGWSPLPPWPPAGHRRLRARPIRSRDAAPVRRPWLAADPLFLRPNGTQWRRFDPRDNRSPRVLAEMRPAVWRSPVAIRNSDTRLPASAAARAPRAATPPRRRAAA